MEQKTLLTFQKKPFISGAGWFFETISFMLGVSYKLLILSTIFVLVSMGMSFIPIVGEVLSNLLWALFTGVMLVSISRIDKDSPISIKLGKYFFSKNVLSFLGLAISLFLSTSFISVLAAFALPIVAGEVVVKWLVIITLLTMYLVVLMITFFSPALIAFTDVGFVKAIKTSLLASLKNIFPLFFLFVIVITLAVIIIMLWSSMFPDLFQTLKASGDLGLDTLTNSPMFFLSIFGFGVMLTAFSSSLSYIVFKDVFEGRVQ